jgi:hypothetical protein
MFLRTCIAAAALGLVAVTGSELQAAQPERCSLGGRYFARSVTKYVVTEEAGYTTIREFRGADVYVPAQPGLTAEWLQRVLSYQVATGECDFGVRDVRVSVIPAGGGFSVRVSGKDERAAAVILQQAQQLVK